MARYIGQTARKPSVRLFDHIEEAKLKISRSHKTHWIEQLIRLGLRPRMEVLEIVASSDADAAECFWIANFRSVGAELLNKTDGGDTHLALVRACIRPGWKQTAEAKAKISRAIKGRPKSAEAKAKMAIAAKRRFAEGRNAGLRYASPTWPPGAKVEPANKGKKLSQIAKDKLAAAAKRRYALAKDRAGTSTNAAGMISP